jgi:hypothetical protein
LTNPEFQEDAVGQRIETCWQAIQEVLAEGGMFPHADEWEDQQRRLARQGSAAVVELYRTVGVTPKLQPDGSLYVHVTDPSPNLLT